MRHIIPIIAVGLVVLVGCHSPSTVHIQPAGASVTVPQGTELIPKAYLAPKYVAPTNAPSNTVIAGRNERGDRLIVTGRALDQGRLAVAGVSIYAFHADADGLYTRDGRNRDENARLFATLRTDTEGRYRYETINGGNDLRGIFLTEAQTVAVRATLPRNDWPYIPTDEPEWGGARQ